MMTHPSDLDRTFHFIMKRMVESGQAPHYTEIASEFGTPMEEGRNGPNACGAWKDRPLLEATEAVVL